MGTGNKNGRKTQFIVVAIIVIICLAITVYAIVFGRGYNKPPQ